MDPIQPIQTTLYIGETYNIYRKKTPNILGEEKPYKLL
jgi:hypothetical protein